jgi:hypothetical protein
MLPKQGINNLNFIEKIVQENVLERFVITKFKKIVLLNL